MPTKSLDKAQRIAEKLTNEDIRKLRQCLNHCVVATIKFYENEKLEYYIEIKKYCEQFIEMLNDFEKRTS